MKRYDELYFKRKTDNWSNLSPEEFLGYLKPKVETALTWDDLETRLKSGKKLNIKLGIDPTGSELHLGHLVPVLLLGQFLRAGHHVDFVIGDFTARIGDPSGREHARQPLTESEIENNFSSYKDQITPYISVDDLTIRRNSEWLRAMTLDQLFPLLQSINLSEAMQRDDFRMRGKNAEGVSLAEATYGLLMGIDSIFLKTDVEIGGIDQLLNFQQCRTAMESKGLPKEVALTTPILVGTAGDGKKMSKSFGNYIALSASSEEKFGRIMSIPDTIVFPYFKSFADVHESELDELKDFIKENPLEAKKQLGAFIVSLSNGSLDSGQIERDSFERKFSKGEISESDATELIVHGEETIFDVIFSSGQFDSKSELRRLFEQNAVVSIRNDDESVLALDDNAAQIIGLVRVGKRKFFSIKKI